MPCCCLTCEKLAAPTNAVRLAGPAPPRPLRPRTTRARPPAHSLAPSPAAIRELLQLPMSLFRMLVRSASDSALQAAAASSARSGGGSSAHKPLRQRCAVWGQHTLEQGSGKLRALLAVPQTALSVLQLARWPWHTPAQPGLASREAARTRRLCKPPTPPLLTGGRALAAGLQQAPPQGVGQRLLAVVRRGSRRQEPWAAARGRQQHHQRQG